MSGLRARRRARADAAKDAVAGRQGEFEPVLTDPLSGRKAFVTIVNVAGETSKESLSSTATSCPNGGDPFLDCASRLQRLLP